MTYEQFTRKIKKKDALDRYWNYFIAIFFIGIGLCFLYLLHFTDWYAISSVTTENITPVWTIHVMSGLFIILGLYGFWRIPITYKVSPIKSDVSIEQKSDIIHQLINDFNLIELESEGQFHHFHYFGRYWSSFNIYLFYDSNNFYINAQENNKRTYIDFGTSKKVTNKIKNKIIELL